MIKEKTCQSYLNSPLGTIMAFLTKDEPLLLLLLLLPSERLPSLAKPESLPRKLLRSSPSPSINSEELCSLPPFFARYRFKSEPPFFLFILSSFFLASFCCCCCNLACSSSCSSLFLAMHRGFSSSFTGTTETGI